LNSELLNSSQKIINYHLSNDPKAKTPTANPTNNVEHSYRIKQLAELVHYTPSLKLKVISSSSLPKGTIITINAQGVEGSFRNALDGITYFGCKKKAKRISKHVRQTEILNDYIIPAISKDIAKKHRGKHFKIEYNIPQNCYKVKDLGVGFGTFYKLDFPLVLKDNHLLNMGLIFMIINIGDLQDNEDPNEIRDTLYNTEQDKAHLGGRQALQLKLFGGICQGEVHVIEPSSSPVRIGRHEECEIHIDDNLLSKFQCTIEYTDDNGWILTDGRDNKPSTNGTWLYIGEEQTIYNGMIFKASQTLFQASLA